MSQIYMMQMVMQLSIWMHLMQNYRDVYRLDISHHMHGLYMTKTKWMQKL